MEWLLLIVVIVMSHISMVWNLGITIGISHWVLVLEL